MASIDVPEWLAGPTIAALLAAGGYLTKMIITAITAVREQHAYEVSQLIELDTLLSTGSVVFAQQAGLRDRLVSHIQARSPQAADLGQGYEHYFQENFASFEPAELELHGVIRAYTEFALKPLNQRTIDWLNSDRIFRGRRGGRKVPDKLGMKLQMLHEHLLLWMAKYEVWIPHDPRHALVYLADESHQGPGFPDGIEDDIRELIETYPRRRGWRPTAGPSNPGSES
jgi:hypothetical protein